MIYQSTAALTNLSFTSFTDGWLIGQTCRSGSGPRSCTGNLLVTSDGGRTWASTPVAIEGEFIGLGRRMASDAWVFGSHTYVNGVPPFVATHDGGITWHQLTAPAGTQGLIFRDASEGWAIIRSPPGIGQVGHTDKTDDGGQTWSTVGDDWCVCAGQVTMQQYGEWTIAPDGTLLHSDDRGATWRPTSEGKGLYVGMRKADQRVGWMAGMFVPHALITGNGGHTWQPAPVPPSYPRVL
jgi:photosystem II stability/assembly factor-like uncharacterized protein